MGRVLVLLELTLLSALFQTLVSTPSDALLRKEQVSQYSEILDKNFNLTWRVNRPHKKIQFQLCQNLGKSDRSDDEESKTWTQNVDDEGPLLFGMGFGRYGKSENADLVLAWREAGKMHWSVADYSTDRKGFFVEDEQSNIAHSGVREKGAATCLRFTRDFDTCDPHDVAIDTGTIYILFFASSDEDPRWTLQNSRLQDLSFQMRPLQLRKSPYVLPSVPVDSDTFDIRVDSVVIPNVDTTYWCRTLKLPEMPQKMHIIGFEGLISPQSEGIVHHLEVFHCEVPPSHKIQHYDAPCNSESKPMGLTSCRKVIGAWAMGAKGLMYPPEAGYPIGGDDFSPYLVIEIHYNNPDLRQGIVDSSGLRFFLSKDLRQYDVGLMELGLDYDPRNSIPPGQSHFHLAGFCTAKCTREALPKQGITVFASQLHTHMTGTQVATYHLRGDKRLQDLNADFHYFPHYQEIRYLQKFVHVLPGDSLVNVCTYDTHKLSNMTFGGISITNEMCLNYIYYYPATKLELCKSIASWETMRRFFLHEDKVERIHFPKRLESNEEYLSHHLEAAFESITWTRDAVRRLQDAYWHGGIHVSCNSSAGHEMHGKWDNQMPPKIPFLQEEKKSKTKNSACQSFPWGMENTDEVL